MNTTLARAGLIPGAMLALAHLPVTQRPALPAAGTKIAEGLLTVAGVGGWPASVPSYERGPFIFAAPAETGAALLRA
jgi:hypothetical protein